MATINIAGIVIPNYHEVGTLHELRVFSDRTWTASDDSVVPGRGDNDTYYDTYTLSVVGDTATVPTVTLMSNQDALNTVGKVAKYTAQVYIDGAPRDVFMPNALGAFTVPSTPTSTTWGALETYNAIRRDIPASGHPTTTEVQNLINIAIGTLNNANVGVLGRIETSAVPVDPAHPIALTPNDSRVADLESASSGIKVKTQIEYDRGATLFTEESAPGAPTLAAGAAGNVDIGSHDYVVTFVTANGRTQAGTLANIVIAATAKQVNLTAIPTGSAFVTAREIWRSKALVPVSAATNVNPVELTTSVNHGLTSGTAHTIAGATGSWTPINGVFTVTVTAANKFTIPVNSTTFGALTGTVTVDPKGYETDKYYLVTTISNNTATTFTDNVSDISLTTAGGLLQNNSTAARTLIGTVPGGWIAQTNTGLGFRAGAFDETRFDANTGEYNTNFGARVGSQNTTGSFNTNVGYEAALANTTGLQNTNVGSQAGSNNVTGINNTMIGQAAGLANLGSGNTAVGSFALWNPQNTTGNVAIGLQSMQGGTLSTGSFNTAAGQGSLFSFTTGQANTAIGWNAFAAVTTGSNNVGIGFASGQNAALGAADNTFLGTNSGKGAAAGFTGSNNVAIGSGGALFVATTANNNTIVGFGSGNAITTGSNNVSLGVNSQQTNATGSNITTIGAGANVGSGALDHATAIGADAVVSTSNTIALGRAAGTDLVKMPGLLAQGVGSALTVSANAIAPTNQIHHVGAGLIKTITVPTNFSGGVLYLIPDAAFTYDATGNIVVPGGGGTAVINKLMILTWDGSKWTPSY